MARRLVFVAVFAAALLGASHAGAQDAAEDARRATDTAGTDDEARGLFLAARRPSSRAATRKRSSTSSALTS